MAWAKYNHLSLILHSWFTISKRYIPAEEGTNWNHPSPCTPSKTRPAAGKEHAGCSLEGCWRKGSRLLCQWTVAHAQWTSSKLKEPRRGSDQAGISLPHSASPKNPQVWCVLIRNSLVGLRIPSSSKLHQSWCFTKKGQTNQHLSGGTSKRPPCIGLCLVIPQCANSLNKTGKNLSFFKVGSRCYSMFLHRVSQYADILRPWLLCLRSV